MYLRNNNPVDYLVRLLIPLCVASTLSLAGGAAWPYEGAVEFGIAAVDIEPAIGIPLAGYGSKQRRVAGMIDWTNKYPGAVFFKPSIGRHSAIRSKAMVIKDGDQQVIFVSVDFVGVEQAMVRDLAKRLEAFGVTAENLIMTGTHTHSGPGTTSHRFAMAITAVDKFNRENYENILDKIQESIELALAWLAPAELLSTSFATSGIQNNKFRQKGQGHYDNAARFLPARSLESGKLLGGMVNYPLHGNGMPAGDLRFSSDVLGQIELNMERMIADHNRGGDQEPVVLFMNGAEGDVGNPVKGEEAVMSYGVQFAEQAVAAGLFDRLWRV